MDVSNWDKSIQVNCKSAYYHIRAMHHIRPAITEDMAKSIACALVGSRLDYANSVLLGVSSKNVTRLQRAQNAAARVVIWAPGGDQQTLLAYLNSYIGCPLSGASSSRSPALPTKPYLPPSLPTSIHPWNITLHLVPCVRLTLNCCSFPVSAHVSVLAASLLPVQLSGTPFLRPYVVVSPLTVFGANSNLSSITLLSGLLNAPPHPGPQIRRVSCWHCALYKFTYLQTS